MDETKYYEPEMGQMAFGQPWQSVECPEYIVALLEGIREEVRRIGGNEYQHEFDPFSDWGDADIFNNQHKDSGFEVWPYSWNDEEAQKYNFKHGDIEISWYKHMGRGTSINKVISPDEAVLMFNECIKNLLEWNKRHMKVLGELK
jgi:hypothetical protein